MAFKMRGFNPGVGTGMAKKMSALKKDIDPPHTKDIKVEKQSKKIKKIDRPKNRGAADADFTSDPKAITDEQRVSGSAAATQFYGTRNVGSKKIKISRTGKHKKKNLGLSEFGKYKDGKAVKRLKVSIAPGKTKKKNVAKKNILTGKRTIKMLSVKGQKKAQESGFEGNFGDTRNVKFQFTGKDKKGKIVDDNAKRKAVFNPKTGIIEEKVKRKSGIGYRKTGRKLTDDVYVSRAREKEKKRNTKIV